MSEIDPILIGKGENPARNTSKHPAVINRNSRKKLFAEYEHHARAGDHAGNTRSHQEALMLHFCNIFMQSNESLH